MRMGLADLRTQIDDAVSAGEDATRPPSRRALGLTKHVTPRALRRTFNDLARAAQVQDVATRSISGHLTEGMQRHDSTMSGDEQRQALAKVIDVTRAHADRESRRAGGQQKKKAGQACA
ncbi:hypothetical protein A7982_13628 [Minicystis rosea]|nr:hypothetical protein A7982_13628 [Minicystis rosea]